MLDQQPAREIVCTRKINARKARKLATLGPPFKFEPFWHDLVLSTQIIAGRRVCSILGLNQVFERGLRARNAEMNGIFERGDLS